jgi:hypothetical protein
LWDKKDLAFFRFIVIQSPFYIKSLFGQRYVKSAILNKIVKGTILIMRKNLA